MYFKKVNFMVCELDLKTAIFLSVLKDLSEGRTLLIRCCLQWGLCRSVVPLLPLQLDTSQLFMASEHFSKQRLLQSLEIPWQRPAGAHEGVPGAS